MLNKILLALCLSLSLYAQKTTPVVILGGGVAGMSAALQISQAGLTPLVIVGPSPGGIITVSPAVENWPGDLSITGSDLADKLEEQLKNRDVQFLSGAVESVDFSRRPFTLKVSGHPDIKADCCIIAMGATPNILGAPGEKGLLYSKIFTCAPCDGLRFKGQTVAVIGGGESALIEAHYLSNIAKQVTIIVRGKEFKTVQTALKEKVLSRPNVKVIFQTTVEKFEETDQGVNLTLSNKEVLEAQGVFLAIGSHPNTAILKKALRLTSEGYIALEKGQSTSVPGVFAAGDISDPVYKQAITAAGDATKAALEAIRYLSLTSPTITEITDLKTLQSTIRASSKPVVAYFSSPSCAPCRSFKPLYEKWAQDYSGVAHFLKINRESCPACFEFYDVQAIPAVLIITPDGKVLDRAVGVANMTNIVKPLEKARLSQSAP